MLLETDRMLSRDFCSADLNDLHAILGDAEAMRYLEPAYTREKTQAFLGEFCIGRRGALAAVHRDSGRLIGYILFKEYEPDVYEIGWIFHRAFWRRGYAYEACRAVLDHAFGTRHARRVFAETTDSVKSVGLMKKLGMQCTEVQHCLTCDNDGIRHDLHLYELLASNRTE